MKLTLESIRNGFSTSDYTRGMQYYQQGRVKELKTVRSGVHEIVTCKVQGSWVYDVMFRDTDRGMIACNCSCPRFEDVGDCKHLAAAMIAYVQSPSVKKQPQSDWQARQMLQTYMEKSQRQAASDKTPVRLVPRLQAAYQLRGEFPTFSFRVGRERLYVVKSIQSFLENVRDRKTVTYGKGLTLDHSIEQFDKPSQALIKLLMNEFEEFRSLHYRNVYYYDYSGVGRQKNEILLTGESFDRIFDQLCGTQVESSSGGNFRFVEEDPQVTVCLEKQGETAQLKVDTHQDLRFFGSLHSLYAQSDNSILRCSDSFREQVYPLMANGKLQMDLALQDLPVFCSCVLPQIQDAVTVEDSEDLLREYLPDECTPCFYFDIEDDILMLKLTFRYGDTEIPEDAPTGETAKIKRDVVAEQAASKQAQQHFVRNKKRQYVMADEDSIFTFLTETLDSYHEYGEVYISERLRGKRIQSVGAGVGISVSEGLLTLDLNTGEFPPEELENLYQSLLRRRKYHRLKDGRYLELDGSPYEKLAEMAHMLQLPARQLKKGELIMPTFRGLYLDALLSDSEGLEIDRDQNFRAMVRNFKSVAESDYAVPAELGGILRPYQKVGFQWLKTLESSGFGGILADEMGLGKTVQVIAYFATLDRQQTKYPSLVVCPASLILNWGEELARFAPGLQVALVMGTAAERKKQIETAGEVDVWVTSYELLRQDIAQYQMLQFYCCVLDEGQHIKNQSTQVSKAVKQINCRQRFVLTGTPIENRLSELWNLFDFLMPGYLFSHSAFVEKLEKPIVKSKDTEASQQLRRLVQPFMLRRLKKDVLKELPQKLEYTRRIRLSDTERKTYLAAVNAAKASMGEDQGKIQILAALTQLRQVCCDPNLCFENYQGETSKLDACLELCTGMVENGHQILLFSQFTSMLDRIRARLDALEITSFTLQGSTPKKKRAELVKAFNAGGASVFLISLKAGGTGLNLTAADVVIHYDPWWNLAAQDQATDRAHRIGQAANVQVYKLIAKDTIEERIMELQERKQSLMDTVSGDMEGSILTMSKEELLALLDA